MPRGVVTLPALAAEDAEAVFLDAASLGGALTLDGNEVVAGSWVGPNSGDPYRVRVNYSHRGPQRLLTIEGFILDSDGVAQKRVETFKLPSLDLPVADPEGLPLGSLTGKVFFYGITKMVLDGPLVNGSIGIGVLGGPNVHVLNFFSTFTGGEQELPLDNGSGSALGAVFDVPRKVGITSAGDVSGVDFTVTGTARGGLPVTEVVTGPNATTALTKTDFEKVLEVSLSATTGANTVTIGTTQQASSEWVGISNLASPTNVAIAAAVSAGATLAYTVEHTFDSDLSPSNTDLVVFPHDNADLVDASTNQNSNYAFPPTATRVTYSTYVSGSVEYTVNQSGLL